MNHKRTWESGRNAAGFAGECARLALRFYTGNRRSDVVTAIEVAECYANGEQIDHATARAVARAAISAISAASAAARVAIYAAHTVADAAADTRAYATVDTVVYAAANAAYAGVDDSEIQIAYARWVTKDLIGDRSLDEELRQAAGAAIVAGDEKLARELLQ